MSCVPSSPSSPSRRRLFLAAAALPLYGLSACSSSLRAGANRSVDQARQRLAALETSSGGRLGVAAWNTDGGARLSHRGAERFALCSTFKVVLAAAVLERSLAEKDLLQTSVPLPKDAFVAHSPITGKQAGKSMTVSALCAAALQYSDNTAANSLMKVLGGPQEVTRYARSIDDSKFRLDRWETELNTALPGDPRDTGTPAAMVQNLHKLLLGKALPAREREILKTWMLGNTTGAARIRAGAPSAASVADKTGSGDYGTTNDIGVVYRSGKPPVILAVYFTQPQKDAPMRNEVVAEAARIVMAAFD
ncbi:MAG TPA: class A beta-lactamase [Prosthecobacter sp.]